MSEIIPQTGQYSQDFESGSQEDEDDETDGDDSNDSDNLVESDHDRNSVNEEDDGRITHLNNKSSLSLSLSRIGTRSFRRTYRLYKEIVMSELITSTLDIYFSVYSNISDPGE